MENDIYEKLIEWLVTTFRALPGVNTSEFREIVHFTYTEEEARLALDMGREGGKLDDMTARTGMKKEDLKSLIESMQKKGTIYTEPVSEDPIYRPLGLEYPGLYETSVWADSRTPFGKKLIELWAKFKPVYIEKGVSELGKHGMVWCMVSALPPDARPEENLFEHVKRNDYYAVSECSCRLMERHAEHGDVCDCIVDCCMAFGTWARWAVEQGHARRITRDEALKILDECEKKGQVHTGLPNLTVCNCCKHACLSFVAQKFGRQHVFMQNHFFAVIDSGTCIACGACVERCPAGAMQLDEEVAVVDQTKCIGCGACATGCGADSIRMARRSEDEIARLDGELAEGFLKLISMTMPDPLMLDALQNT